LQGGLSTPVSLDPSDAKGRVESPPPPACHSSPVAGVQMGQPTRQPPSSLWASTGARAYDGL